MKRLEVEVGRNGTGIGRGPGNASVVPRPEDRNSRNGRTRHVEVAAPDVIHVVVGRCRGLQIRMGDQDRAAARGVGTAQHPGTAAGGVAPQSDGSAQWISQRTGARAAGVRAETVDPRDSGRRQDFPRPLSLRPFGKEESRLETAQPFDQIGEDQAHLQGARDSPGMEFCNGQRVRGKPILEWQRRSRDGQRRPDLTGADALDPSVDTGRVGLQNRAGGGIESIELFVRDSPQREQSCQPIRR